MGKNKRRRTKNKFDQTDTDNLPNTAYGFGNPPQMNEDNRRFLRKVFFWMICGLGLTGVSGWQTAGRTENFAFFYGETWGVLVSVLGWFALTIWLFAFRWRHSVSRATFLYLLWCVLSGVQFAALLRHYPLEIIGQAFLAASVYFLVLSLIAWLHRGNPIGLDAIISAASLAGIASLGLNWLLDLSWKGAALSVAGIVFFSGMTVNAVRRALKINIPGNAGSDADAIETIYGALEMVLAFFGLFVDLLRLLTRRRA